MPWPATLLLVGVAMRGLLISCVLRLVLVLLLLWLLLLLLLLVLLVVLLVVLVLVLVLVLPVLILPLSSPVAAALCILPDFLLYVHQEAGRDVLPGVVSCHHLGGSPLP